MGVDSGSEEGVLRLLLLEDSDLDAELIEDALAGTGLPCRLSRVVARDEFIRAVAGSRWDLILADYVLPTFDGLSALEIAAEHCPNTPFIFVSGMLGEEIAVEALKRGATDYVLKQRLQRLPYTIRRALAEATERADRQRAQEALQRLLEERTNLLHELDHRVKNHLQLMLSLVSMEIRQSGSPEARGALSRVRERLQALGAAHRELYDGRNRNRLDLSDFTRALCEELVAGVGRGAPVVTYDFDPAPVDSSRAAALALLLNEILSSALSNIFASRHGRMHVSLKRRDNVFCIELSDSRFTPDEKASAREGTSGLVVGGLARQLEAEVTWPEDEPSVLVRVTLPAHGDPAGP
jgi:two-component sensor histidine kinase